MITIQERLVGSIRLRLVCRPDPNPELPPSFYLLLSSSSDGKYTLFRRYGTASQRLAELWFERTYENESAYQLRQMEECIA